MQEIIADYIRIQPFNLFLIGSLQFLLLFILFYSERRNLKLQAYIENYISEKYVVYYNYFRSFFDILILLLIPSLKLTKKNITSVFFKLVFFSMIVTYICEIFFVNYPLLELFLNVTIKNSVLSIIWYILTTDTSEIFLKNLSKFNYVLFGFVTTILSQIADIFVLYFFEIVPYDFIFRGVALSLLGLILNFLNNQPEDIDTLQKDNINFKNIFNIKIHKKILNFKIPLVSFAIISTICLLLIFNLYKILSFLIYKTLEKPVDLKEPITDYTTLTPAYLINCKIPIEEKNNSINFKLKTILLQFLLFLILFSTQKNNFLQKYLKLVIYSFTPFLFIVNQLVYYKNQSKLKHGSFLVYNVFRRTCKEIPYLCFTYETKMYIRYVSEIIYESGLNIFCITLNTLFIKKLANTYGIYSSIFLFYTNIYALFLLLSFTIINTLQIYLIYKNYNKKIDLFKDE